MRKYRYIEDDATLGQAVRTCIGAASGCWVYKMFEGRVFDEQRANEIANELIDFVQTLHEEE